MGQKRHGRICVWRGFALFLTPWGRQLTRETLTAVQSSRMSYEERQAGAYPLLQSVAVVGCWCCLAEGGVFSLVSQFSRSILRIRKRTQQPCTGLSSLHRCFRFAPSLATTSAVRILWVTCPSVSRQMLLLLVLRMRCGLKKNERLVFLLQVATAMVNLGRVLEEKGQYTDALIYLKKGLTIREKVLEEGHPDTVSALAWIGVSPRKNASCRPNLCV